MLVMLGDGSENGAKVDRFEGRFGDVIAGSKGKRGARENDRVSGSCCGRLLVPVPGIRYKQYRHGEDL